MPPSTPNPDWRNLHLWQMQPVRDVLVIAGVFAVVWLGYVLSIVTVPILLAMLLSYLFEPLVARMTRSGRVGRARVALSIVVLAVVLVGVPVVLGTGYSIVQGVKFVQNVAGSVDLVSKSVRSAEDPVLRHRVEERGRAWILIRDFIVRARTQHQAAPAAEPSTLKTDGAAPSGAVEEGPEARPEPGGEPRPQTKPAKSPDGSAFAADISAAEQIIDQMPGAEEPSDLFRVLEWSRVWLEQNASLIGKNIVSAGGGALGALLLTVGSVGKFLFGAFLTAFFFFFFSTGYGRLLVFWRGLLPERKKGRLLDLVGQMDTVISGFVRGRLMICTVLMVVYTFGYWLIGVPAPFVIGPITGLLTLIPYAAGIMLPLAMLLMWLDPADGLRAHWWWMVMAPLALTGLAQVLDDYVLTPRIQGKTTNMDTPTILFASIAGGTLAGFYGLLIAIPTAACIKILLREFFWPRLRDWASGKASDLLPISKE